MKREDSVFSLNINIGGKSLTSSNVLFYGNQLLGSFKICSSFLKKAHDIFANDTQHLFDATQRLASLKYTNQKTLSHVANAKVVLEGLKSFLGANSLENVNKKLDKLHMVLILRCLHLDVAHILNGNQIYF